MAGGATPGCFRISPAGHLVEYGNGRAHVWKDWSDAITACRGIVAPDDSSCIEDDVSPFMYTGKDGERADLELSWSKPVPNGPSKKVATISRGRNRDGGDPKWWTVTYCSPNKAIVDVTNGPRIAIDARTGDAKPITKAATICP